MSLKETPLVSVLTLTYKKFQYFYETLDSIFLQDYPNIELIIGDDASPEFPKDQIEAYIAIHKSENITNVVIYSNGTNLGTVKNANRALSLTKGAFVLDLGSDDAFYDAGVVSDVVAEFTCTNAAILTCRRQEVNFATGEVMRVLPGKREIGYLERLSPEAQYKKLLVRNYVSSACTYYSRSLLKQFGPYDERYKYLEDYPYYLRLCRLGVRIAFIDRITVRYRVGDGMSTGNKQTGCLVRTDARKMYTECLSDDTLSGFFKRLLRFRIGRIDTWEQGLGNKLKLALRYPDVIIYYLLLARS